MSYPKQFDINKKRKLLYKRKKRRKFIFYLTCIICFIGTLFIIKSLNNIHSNKNLASSLPISNKFIICIDAGHGDFDVGAKGITGSLEKDIDLSIALKLGKILESEENIKVVYTRTNDSMPWIDNANDSLKERLKISTVFKSNLFISIHCNSNYDDTSARGYETWYKSNDEESKKLSNYIQIELSNIGFSEDRGIKTYNDKEDALAVLELNTATSALVELGFLSNTSDERYLSSENGQNFCAYALKDAILNYINDNHLLNIE